MVSCRSPRTQWKVVIVIEMLAQVMLVKVLRRMPQHSFRASLRKKRRCREQEQILHPFLSSHQWKTKIQIRVDPESDTEKVK